MTVPPWTDLSVQQIVKKYSRTNFSQKVCIYSSSSAIAIFLNFKLSLFFILLTIVQHILIVYFRWKQFSIGQLTRLGRSFLVNTFTCAPLICPSLDLTKLSTLPILQEFLGKLSSCIITMSFSVTKDVPSLFAFKR